jgi:6-phospho-3-hexuloisomerase
VNLQKHFDSILHELRRALARVGDERAERLVEAIAAARRIFVAGAGRSGLAMKGFAMRLMHLGFEAYVVSETVTPGITQEDMLLVGSGSGATASLVVSAEKARAVGAGVGLITIQEDSPIGRLADTVLTIPAPTPKIEEDLGFSSIQPMGSLFEQALMLTLDALVLVLMAQSGRKPEAMFARHANLE